jgi:hydroxyethylthiazole kinase-like uncharacterized protein yjeF
MEIVTAQQMYEADSAAIKSGISGEQLMENAGAAVVRVIKERFAPCHAVILCGSGNNGGDGFVVARILKLEGWQVSLALLGDIGNLKGDAAIAAEKYSGEVIALEDAPIEDADLIIDAIFGIGLKRPADGVVADIIERIGRNVPVIAVDIPSGLASNCGDTVGVAFKADLTVTFTRKKLCHVLYPAKKYCGEVVVVDIGIDDEIISELRPNIFENSPKMWVSSFPFPKDGQNKYDRGHAVVNGGGIKCTGAASLASLSALHAGAGLVTVVCPENAIMVYATKLTAVMVKSVNNSKEFIEFISDKRRNAVLIGPGNGVDKLTYEYALAALGQKKSCVIDADAITVFSEKPDELFASIRSPVILTPHEGEFKRIFNVEGDKVSRARAAAKISKAVIILKGTDTIIASPDGRVVINTNAPACLATAGSGDVLAGVTLGLLANNMDAFLAACASVWIHGEAAKIAGIGMISESLPSLLPQVLQELYRDCGFDSL